MVRSCASSAASSHAWLAVKAENGRFSRPVLLSARTRSSNDRVVAVTSFQSSQVRAGLVGDEALKAVPVEVAKRQLGAGMGTLAAADQSRARRPRVEADVAGQLAHPGAV